MAESGEYKIKYRLRFPAKWSKLDIELYCFRIAHSEEKGGLGKAEHFWNIIALLYGPDNPVGNRTKIFIRNPWSEDIVNALCEYRYVAAGGCAGSTKSETCALWLLICFLSDARNTLGVVLSTDLKQARKRIWGYMEDFVKAVPSLPLKVISSQGMIRYKAANGELLSDRSSLSLVAAERKQEKEAVGKLIGMHNYNVIVIADELSELTLSLLEYALPGGNLTSNPRYQFVGLSNPNSYFDPFGLLWKPKEGWTSITVEDTRWESVHGISLHFDALKSPNVLAGQVLYPFLPTAQKIADARKAEGGDNSIRFWRMIRGFICPTGQEDLIYHESDIIKFKGEEPAIWGDRPVIRVAALDPGFTNGGDRTILYFGSLGYTRDNVKVLNFDGYIELLEDVRNQTENRSYQIARQLKEACEKIGVLPEHCACDATGAGAPFCDVVDVVWSRRVLRVKFGGKASDLPVSLTDSVPGHARYYDRVTELWYVGKEYLRQGQLKGIHPQMALEMTQRKYGTIGSEKKIYAESKVDMKLRTKQSPDVADAGFILLDLCRQRLGFVAVIMVQGPSGFMHRQKSSWGNLRRKLSAKRNMPRRL
jgi:hypothetical protein